MKRKSSLQPDVLSMVFTCKKCGRDFDMLGQFNVHRYFKLCERLGAAGQSESYTHGMHSSPSTSNISIAHRRGVDFIPKDVKEQRNEFYNIPTYSSRVLPFSYQKYIDVQQAYDICKSKKQRGCQSQSHTNYMHNSSTFTFHSKEDIFIPKQVKKEDAQSNVFTCGSCCRVISNRDSYIHQCPKLCGAKKCAVDQSQFHTNDKCNSSSTSDEPIARSREVKLISKHVPKDGNAHSNILPLSKFFSKEDSDVYQFSKPCEVKESTVVKSQSHTEDASNSPSTADKPITQSREVELMSKHVQKDGNGHSNVFSCSGVLSKLCSNDIYHYSNLCETEVSTVAQSQSHADDTNNPLSTSEEPIAHSREVELLSKHAEKDGSGHSNISRRGVVLSNLYSNGIYQYSKLCETKVCTAVQSQSHTEDTCNSSSTSDESIAHSRDVELLSKRAEKDENGHSNIFPRGRVFSNLGADGVYQYNKLCETKVSTAVQSQSHTEDTCNSSSTSDEPITHSGEFIKLMPKHVQKEGNVHSNFPPCDNCGRVFHDQGSHDLHHYLKLCQVKERSVIHGLFHTSDLHTSSISNVSTTYKKKEEFIPKLVKKQSNIRFNNLPSSSYRQFFSNQRTVAQNQSLFDFDTNRNVPLNLGKFSPRSFIRSLHTPTCRICGKVFKNRGLFDIHKYYDHREAEKLTDEKHISSTDVEFEVSKPGSPLENILTKNEETNITSDPNELEFAHNSVKQGNDVINHSPRPGNNLSSEISK